jgi:dipeptidyl aminopeptidase/acylaminoacyl peptidase
LTVIVIAVGLLHVMLQAVLAGAVAFAPNATLLGSTPSPTPMPELLSRRGARVLRTEVGPPSATVSSWLVEPKQAQAKGTIVLLHGVRMDKRSLAPMAVALSDAGYRTLLVDLRGHGESSGSFLTYGAVEVLDVSRILDSLAVDGTELGPVGVYGFSYGGAVALQLGSRDPRVKAVVAAAPFSTLDEVLGDYRRRYLPHALELLPDWWFRGATRQAGSLAGFDADAAGPYGVIARSSARILLLHGDADTQVPLRHSQMLAGATHGRARLLVLSGGTHETIPADASGVVRREAVSWFDQALAPRAG